MVEIIDKLSDSAQYKKRRDVISDSGNKHRVSIRKSDGRWTCDCMGWTRVCNAKGTDCVHIKKLKQKYGPLFNDDGSSQIEEIKLAVVALLTMASPIDGWNAIRSKVELVSDFLELTGGDDKKDFDNMVSTVKKRVLEETVK